MIVTAAFDQNDPTKADVYVFQPETIAAALDLNLASREERMPNLKKTAPIFVCLEPVNRSSASAGGANLKAEALWSAKIDLNGGILLRTSKKRAKYQIRYSRGINQQQNHAAISVLIKEFKAAIAKRLEMEPSRLDLQLKIHR
jgi:hypothetical protein